MKLYSCAAVANLIGRYADRGGSAFELVPGVLGYGLTVCTGDGLKTAVIQEKPINEWSSDHAVRFYNRLPRKYAAMIEKSDMEG